MDTDPNAMVYCPYNKAHKMLRKKLQQHILKCRELYKDEIELLVCPFNKAHLIPEPEFLPHTRSCIDRKIIAHYQHSAPAELTEDTRHEKIATEENWDDDDVPDYNPQLYVSTANVVREPNGMFPSQRKAFIKEERKRLLGQDSDEDSNEKTQSRGGPTKTTSPTTQRSAPYKLPNRHR
ncbi:gametocyte-specific factor 1 homolog [Drosophila montana]|uniref:gametocyte-specific factor 1 homolog n=1 Tax=Drosophila montana TaxID=40370 RepID=UPI00313BCE2F